MNTIAAPSAFPRSGLISVHAGASGNGVETLIRAFEDFKARYDKRLGELEACTDDQARINAAHRLNGGPAERGEGPPNDPEYVRASPAMPVVARRMPRPRCASPTRRAPSAAASARR